MENRKYQYDGIIVGENIRRERLRLGLTTEQLAELVDKSARHINKVELGWSKLSIDLLYDFMNGISQDVIEVRFSAKYQCKTVDGVIAIIHEHLDIVQNAGAEILGFINSK